MSSLPPYTGDLATRLGAALSTDKDTDVVFTFENGEEVKAHRLILATGSPVFDAMFYGGLAEKNKTIPVPDVEANIFGALVHFLYTDKVNPNEADVPLLYAAKKYQVAAVEKACEKYLSDNINSGNVYSILDQAILFSADHLRDKCLEVIALKSLLAIPGLESLSRKGLCAVLEMEAQAVKETDVLTIVRQWARFSCENQGLEVKPENERLVLGPALYLIRFPLLTTEEFTPIASSGLLSLEEAFGVYREIGGEKGSSCFIARARKLSLGASFSAPRVRTSLSHVLNLNSSFPVQSSPPQRKEPLTSASLRSRLLARQAAKEKLTKPQIAQTRPCGICCEEVENRERELVEHVWTWHVGAGRLRCLLCTFSDREKKGGMEAHFAARHSGADVTGSIADDTRQLFPQFAQFLHKCFGEKSRLLANLTVKIA